MRSYKTARLSLCLGLVVLAAFIGIVTLIGPQPAQAAPNNTLNFQARLQTSSGAIVPDGFYNVEFKLYSASSGGTFLWNEEHYDSNGVTAGNDNRIRVKNGYLTVSLGSQNAFPTTINWDQELWITMNIGGTTQTATPTYDGEMNPRLKLTGVPYAFRAGMLATGNGTLQSTLQILQPTVGNQIFQIQDQAAAGTYNLCIQNSTACGFAAASGSANYIQNTTSPQAANIAITSAATGSISLAVQALTGQTADLINVDGLGTRALNYDASGTLILQAGSGQATALLSLRDTSGSSVAGINTSGDITARFISSNGTIEARSYSGSGSALTANQNGANATVPVFLVQGGATPGAGGDLLRLQNSAATALFTVGSSGNITTSGTYNTNTFSSNTLTFGASGAASIQSASTYSLTVDSGTTGALNLGTGANAKVVTLGNNTGTTAVAINSGTGDISLRSAASTIVRPTVDTATTFQIQNSAGTRAINFGYDGSNVVLTSTGQDIVLSSRTYVYGAELSVEGVLAATNISSIYANNPSSTITNGLLVERLAGGTLTNGINITRTAGTLTNGIQLTGTMTNLINATNFTVSGAGNITAAGTYNTNTFTSSALTFGAASAASIQSASAQNLTIDSGTTGALNFGTGANAKTITLGNNTGATALFLNAGSGGINMGFNSASPINIATGTSTALVSLGNGNGTFALNTTNIDISAAGAISGATGITMSGGNFSQVGSGTFSTGTGAVALNGDTTVRSDTATAFRVQNTAGTTTFLGYDSTLQRLTLRALSDSSPLGSELMVNGFPATTGWTAISGTGQTATATHTSGGGTTSLGPSPAITPTIGLRYKLKFTLSNITSGSVTVSIGNSGVSSIRANGTYEITAPAASTTNNLLFTPSNLFNGTVSAVSVREITGVSVPLVVADSSGAGALALRVNSAAALSTYLGNGAGGFSGTGMYNTAIGAGALTDNYSGSNNTALGYTALFNGGGSDNTAIGYQAADYIYSGSRNTSLGSLSLGAVRGGSNNTAIGYRAGDVDSAGFTTSEVLNNTTVIGYDAQAQTDDTLILGGAGIYQASGSSAVRVGIGTPRPINIFSVMPTQYDTGTITQSGNTVTGSGTTFTAAMVGNRFSTAGGTSANITSFISATQITISISQTIASPDSYRIHYNGLQVGDTGNVGVGVQGPAYRLDVADAQSSSYVAQIQNTSTANTADGLLINLGVANASRGTGNYFVGFAGAGTVAGKIQGGASSVAYTTTAADYAEYFRADPGDMPLAAELVQVDRSADSGVVRSGSDTQVNLVGVVSTNPGFIGNGPLCLVGDDNCEADYAKYNALIALSGQVPVKVNDSNGAIAIGDPVGVSATSGEGAKATAAGYIVGYAQEALAGDNGVIKVLVRPQYYSPQPLAQSTGLMQQVDALQAQLSDIGSLLNTGSLRAGTLTVTGDTTLEGGLLVLGKTVVSDLQIRGHIVSGGETPEASLLPAAGVSDATIAVEPSVSIVGNDTAGVIKLRTGGNASDAELLRLVFHRPFEGDPRVFITPVGRSSSDLQSYVAKSSNTGFTLGVSKAPYTGQAYEFNYLVIQ